MSFFEMGGYAAYVWPAFGIGAVVMIGLLLFSIRRLRLREAELRRLEKASGGQRRRGSAQAENEQDEATP